MRIPRIRLLVLGALVSLPVFARSEEAPPMKPEFREKMLEAIAAYHNKDFDTASAKVDEAEAIQPGTTAVMNLRGAIALERGKYEDARKQFDAALKVDPAFYPAKFNLGEIPFKQKKYAEAREVYAGLLEQNAGDELAQYKIFLTYLLEKKMDEAEKALDQIKFPSDTPAYYFAHAAWEYSRANAKEAEEWIASSVRIFPPHVNLIYAETLEELGWLKRKPAAEPTPQ